MAISGGPATLSPSPHTNTIRTMTRLTPRQKRAAIRRAAWNERMKARMAKELGFRNVAELNAALAEAYEMEYPEIVQEMNWYDSQPKDIRDRIKLTNS